VTIILSVVTAEYAVQVSDRLLTQKVGNRYAPWDRASNKSIIMLARDGLVTMGYSGPGHISGATMDGWIAGVLSGEAVGVYQPRPNFGLRVGGSRPSLPLHKHLTAVSDRLNAAVRAAKVTNKLRVSYVGFRWQSLNKPAWPVFGRIGWDAAHGAYAMGMSKRRWEPGRNYAFAASGRSRQRAQAMLRERLPRTTGKEETAATLIQILRELPPSDPTVGRDCLVTTIQRIPPYVHIKYEAHDIRQVAVAFTGPPIIELAAFTPWIVTPDLISVPQALVGQGVTHHSGVFDFSIEGPNPDGDLTILSSQQRSLWRL
jgi:hypothetical protein